MNLRQAAEMAVEMFDWLERRSMYQDLQMKETHEALRQALAHEALDRMVAENQRLGLYDEDNLQTAIEKGTKAWADVPNATEWVEELRGNTPDCKTHPDAPHGFDRNASHSADRYVCECEGWEPPKREWVGLTDDEIWDIGVDNQRKGGGFWGYPRALEAKLKEKNGG